MTGQTLDEVEYNGEVRVTWETPLYQYFSRADVHLDVRVPSSTLFGGLNGQWLIVNDRLYLTGVVAELEDGTRVTLESLFPVTIPMVFAHWYSGVMTVDDGRLLDRGYQGYLIGAIYERKIHLVFRRGVLLETYVQSCSVPPPRQPERVGLGTRIARGIKGYFTKPLPNTLSDRPPFAVTASDLKERFTVEEIEARELVKDPPQTVPDVPFGYFHHMWVAFMGSHQPGDELWWFESVFEEKYSTRYLHTGYVRVRNGVIGEHFLVEKFDLREGPLSPYFGNASGYKC